ncbi:MAG: hypothetical protein HC831_15530 [Chloroflexia bacterium]|nr:hypothetical protein [Chloroflexia bacterium]
MTPELEKVIDDLRQRIDTIKGLHSTALEENNRLKDEIKGLSAQIENKENKMNN